MPTTSTINSNSMWRNGTKPQRYRCAGLWEIASNIWSWKCRISIRTWWNIWFTYWLIDVSPIGIQWFRRFPVLTKFNSSVFSEVVFGRKGRGLISARHRRRNTTSRIIRTSTKRRIRLWSTHSWWVRFHTAKDSRRGATHLMLQIRNWKLLQEGALSKHRRYFWLAYLNTTNKITAIKYWITNQPRKFSFVTMQLIATINNIYNIIISFYGNIKFNSIFLKNWKPLNITCLNLNISNPKYNFFRNQQNWEYLGLQLT